MFNYLEILVLTVINSGGIFLVIVLLANSLNDKLFRWFTIMAVTILGWVNFAYLGYNNPTPETSLLFYKINGAFVSLFLYAEYMVYIEGFLGVNKRLVRWLLGMVSTLFVILILLTDSVLASVTWQGWGNEIAFGSLNDIFSAFALLINISIIIILITKYFNLQSDEKMKIKYFLVGTFLFIFFNIAFNVISPELFGTARYQHLGDYSASFFLIFTAYAILRHKFMNIKIALAALLIGVMGMLVIVDIFALSHNLVEQGLKFAILIFFSIISILLVRSVLNEVKQREELAKVNKELEVRYQELRQIRARERDMMDIMGHELRTPLSIIKISLGSLDLKAKKTPEKFNTEVYWPHSAKMHDAINRETQLLETMLTSTKIDARKLELAYEKVDIKSVIEDSLLGHQQQIDDKKLEIVKNNLNDSIYVYADNVRLSEVIDNLINNAVKYTNQGKIEVMLEEVEKDMVKVSIRDTGMGIPKEAISRLGEKFYRVRQYVNGDENGNSKANIATVVRPGGTGLGLYVTFGLIRMMGGEVEVESEVGVGSVFSFTIPKFTGQKETGGRLASKDIFKRMGLANGNENPISVEPVDKKDPNKEE